MDDLMNEIRAAVSGRAWILALTGTLALVDACAAVESDTGWATRDKFKPWWTQHLGPKYPQLDADELYQLRNSLLHTGRTVPPQGGGNRYSRFIFVAPVNGNVFHNNVINDALNLDLPTFCSDVLTAATRWRKAVESTDAYQRNAEHLIRWYPGGLPPYMVGAPVLT